MCVVAQQRKDDLEGGPCFQLPSFSVTDLTRESGSYDLLEKGYFLTKAPDALVHRPCHAQG